MSIVLTDKSRRNKNENNEHITDFGIRTLNRQNFSRTVVLPKIALKNCGCDVDEDCKVNISLVQNGDDAFIKILPLTTKKDEDDDQIPDVIPEEKKPIEHPSVDDYNDDNGDNNDNNGDNNDDDDDEK